MAKTVKETPEQRPYNPFFVTLNGITTLFSGALSIGIVLLLVDAAASTFSFMSNGSDSDGKATSDFLNNISSLQPSELLVAACIGLVIIIFGVVIGAMIHGIQSYTAVALSKNETVTIGEAFNATLNNFGNYILMYVLMNIKIFLWFLLLIVPGIIAYYRYSFAGMVFFEKELRFDAAIKESNRLTKGGLMTLISSHLLFSLITLTYIPRVVWLASTSELYREYKALDNKNLKKPGIHWLSWVTIATPFVLFLFGILFAIGIALIITLMHSQVK